MSEPFIAEIRIFAGNYAPSGWAFCDGQIMPISQNTALFSLIGTTYGGDGRSTYGLPNLQGRTPMHSGTGPGLTPRRLGQQGGRESVSLTEAQIPNHSHTSKASSKPATENKASPGHSLGGSIGGDVWSSQNPDAFLDKTAISAEGGNQAHNNMQPFLAMNFIIALVGLYPTRA